PRPELPLQGVFNSDPIVAEPSFRSQDFIYQLLPQRLKISTRRIASQWLIRIPNASTYQLINKLNQQNGQSW
ncbi:hypothetical protein SODALDRAFT_311860, partial [Sodiomyces alkalinus F11]